MRDSVCKLSETAIFSINKTNDKDKTERKIIYYILLFLFLFYFVILVKNISFRQIQHINIFSHGDREISL